MQDYQEIDLADYIKILLKRRKLIFTITALCIVGALLYAFSTTFSYEAESLIQIGEVNGNLITSVDQTKLQLLNRNTIQEILEKLQTEKALPITNSMVDGFLENVRINNGETKNVVSKVPENFLRINYTDNSPQRALRGAELLQQRALEIHQNELEIKIAFRDTGLAEKKRNLKQAKENLATTEKAIEEIYHLRYPSSYAEAQGRGLATYITLRDALQNKIELLEHEIENLELLIKTKDKASKILASPKLPSEPRTSSGIRPLTAGTLGLIIGVFLGISTAFIFEWWEKNKHKLAL